MATVATSTRTASPSSSAWWPLILLPVASVFVFSDCAPWIFMWCMAGSIYLSLKWLSFAYVGGFRAAGSKGLAIGYLIAWPGMDATTFFDANSQVAKPTADNWAWAIAKTALGIVLFWGVGRLLISTDALLAGWIGMAGLIFTLHFGIFHISALLWQNAGVNARPIMNIPFLAASLSDFWGRRWNLAVRDLAHTFVFRPLVSRTGIAIATLSVFTISGVFHDLVISLPARTGFGLPTVYFLGQGIGLLIERSRLGRAIGLGRGVTGRAFVFVVTGLGAMWLFHPAFIREVVIPMMHAAGAL